MALFDIKVNDYSQQVLNALNNGKLPTALAAIGEECVGYAQDDCPVDTGNLRSSITKKVVNEDKAVYVGTNVEYGVYVEYGDYAHAVGKKHFLRDAAANHADHYEEILKAALDS